MPMEGHTKNIIVFLMLGNSTVLYMCLRIFPVCVNKVR